MKATCCVLTIVAALVVLSDDVRGQDESACQRCLSELQSSEWTVRGTELQEALANVQKAKIFVDKARAANPGADELKRFTDELAKFQAALRYQQELGKTLVDASYAAYLRARADDVSRRLDDAARDLQAKTTRFRKHNVALQRDSNAAVQQLEQQARAEQAAAWSLGFDSVLAAVHGGGHVAGEVVGRFASPAHKEWLARVATAGLTPPAVEGAAEFAHGKYIEGLGEFALAALPLVSGALVGGAMAPAVVAAGVTATGIKLAADVIGIAAAHYEFSVAHRQLQQNLGVQQQYQADDARLRAVIDMYRLEKTRTDAAVVQQQEYAMQFKRLQAKVEAGLQP